MRCLGISRNWDEDGLESAADTIFDTLGCEGGEDEVVYLDDLYTPGTPGTCFVGRPLIGDDFIRDWHPPSS